MTTTPVSLLFADCDLTLITFDAEAGYRAAADALSERVTRWDRDELYREMLAQYHAIHDNGGTVRKDIAAAFQSYASTISYPEEAMWSRFAAFMCILARHGSVTQDHGIKNMIACVEREFWRAVSTTSKPFDDTTPLVAAAWRVGATIQPITSSDVRLVEDPGNAVYRSEDSVRMKQARIEDVLGRFMPPVIVFEEFRKASEEGWRRYVQPRYTPEQIRDAAIIGDSLSDIAAGVTMGMPVRILIDREGRYPARTAYAEGATHLVRSLEEVPAILGWC